MTLTSADKEDKLVAQWMMLAVGRNLKQTLDVYRPPPHPYVERIDQFQHRFVSPMLALMTSMIARWKMLP